MNPHLPLADGLNLRLWHIASMDATEDEKWRMQLFLIKARESRTEDLKLGFFDHFNRLAAAIIERSLPAPPLLRLVD